MTSCEMCGKAGAQFRALVEGVEMSVCRECTRFGKMLQRPQQKQVQARQAPAQKPMITEHMVDDIGERIKAKRERMKLTQEDLALKLAEKTSLLVRVESGKAMPSLALARKLEQFFHIRLVEKAEEANVAEKPTHNSPLTIGDMLKQKMQ